MGRVVRDSNYIREHFIDYEFIHEFLCLIYDYYDGPLSGMLNIHGHYFLFECEEMPEWRGNGKLDKDGDADYDFYTGKYSIRPISKINAWYKIWEQAWFIFCVYRSSYGHLHKLDNDVLIFADKFAGMKPDWVHKFISNHLYMGGMYYARFRDKEVVI